MFLWHWLTKSPAPEADLYQFVSRIITPFVGNTFVVVPLLPSAIAFVFSAVMETLAASSAKLLVYVENQNPRDKQTGTGFSCQAPTTRAAAAAARSRPEIRFLGYLNKHANFGYSSSLSLSFHRKTIHPISSVPALSQVISLSLAQLFVINFPFYLLPSTICQGVLLTPSPNGCTNAFS